MKVKFLKTFGILIFSLFLTGMLNDVFAQKASAQVETAPVLQDALSDSGDNNDFAYSPKGRRDPFKPLIQEKKKVIATKIVRKERKIKGPLEKFELGQYRLIALMVVKGIPRAMVKAPDGKSYTVKVGEYIGMNDGIVKRIETKIIAVDKNGLRIEKSPDRIVVEEVGVDSYTGKVVKENRYITM
ncbi:MAG: pilus assembly protein PilP [Desulfuromusa sp.]|nr:pilus assembly protein PilP [Desulfuromusa sp.]